MNQSAALKALLAVGSLAASIIAISTSANKHKDEDKLLTQKQRDKLWDKVSHLEEADWYCDKCDACLNEQRGFTTKRGKWKCRECGYVNSIHHFDLIYDD